MFSIAQLLNPISAAQACGEDLSFSSELDAIARARVHDDPSLDQGEWVVALKEADWPFVASRCAQLIESKSKDLRLAVWLAEAHAKTRHFRGLGDGYTLLAGLCEHYWDGLYPAPDDGEYEQRIGNLFWLLTRSPRLIREIPVTDGSGGSYSLADYDAARQRAAGGAGAADPWGGAAPGDGPGPGLAQFDAARRQNSRQFNDALLADAEYCLQALLALERCVDARLGAAGPGFGLAREALQQAIDCIAPLATAAPGGEPAAAATSCGVAGAAGGAQSRAQALAQLRQVAAFFRRTEPHSPVAYLADKAADWGELPLHLWLRAVVKDPAVVAQLDELLGAAGPG
ncbi:type VI secretion system protein TssA [Janthinobacterium fluminis]|uniref:Type VI secretion system protein TssA n=1 Tax=Janthinobacterium fluminis TaxID=2987524 RepID=A0ABT5JTC8_9BURK|nr:type VI secretion system protein TssA [Janthinobacterium fluminis]MDC8756008.1 type VI secretion system protein TssA [Janthinobacterium fluminis]